MAAWTTSGYRHLDTTTVRLNVRLSIVRDGTVVKSKRNFGSEWEDDADAVTVGDLEDSGKSCTLEVRSDGAVIVTNGFEKNWISKNMGASWTALP